MLLNKALQGSCGLSRVQGLVLSLALYLCSEQWGGCVCPPNLIHPFPWGALSGGCGAVLVAVGTLGGMIVPETSRQGYAGCCAWGLLPAGWEGSRGPWPQVFCWESKWRVGFPCSASKATAAGAGRKALLLTWLLAISGKMAYFGGCHICLRGLCRPLCGGRRCGTCLPSVDEPRPPAASAARSDVSRGRSCWV